MKKLRAICVLAALLGVAGLACRSGRAPATPVRAGFRLPKGVVVAPEPLAAEVGAAVLRRGGNAVDAAVAVHFALAVTYPQAGNIGGGGVLLVGEPGGSVRALDFRETAPAKATERMFVGADGKAVADRSLVTHLAAGVPGSVRGMAELHAKYGSLPWKELLDPAIGYARRGFPLDPATAGRIVEKTRALQLLPEPYRDAQNFWKYFRGAAGEKLVQTELARTLDRIALRGADGFYTGETAELLAKQMSKERGLVTAADLASYRAIWREPVEGTFRGLRVSSFPLPSSGGILLLQLLSMTELAPIPVWHSPKHLHRVAEMEKRVFADRAAWMGDPAFFDVPVARLLSKDYARIRASSIPEGWKSDPTTIQAGGYESAETTHYSIVDRNGMSVSCTTTLNDRFGSGLVVEGAGFLLNNQMDDFATAPGAANLYGLVGSVANKVEPGKRMLSSMTPTIVFDRGGRLWLILGTPGGSTIPTTVYQVLVNRIDFNMSLSEAVVSPRFHHQWPAKPNRDDVSIEEDYADSWPAETLDALTRLGYTIDRRSALGDVQAIEIDERGAFGVPDPRGRGTVKSE